MDTLERRPEETAKAWSAFRIYRGLGQDRSLQKAADLFYGRPGASKGQLEAWSSKHDWVRRCRAWDDFLEMERRDAVEKHLLGRAAELDERREALREKNLANQEKAAELQKRVLQAFSEMPLVRTRLTKTDEEGRPVEYVVEPAVKSLDLAAQRLHRIATHDEHVREALVEYDLSKATDEQLERIIAGEHPGRVLGEGGPAGRTTY